MATYSSKGIPFWLLASAIWLRFCSRVAAWSRATFCLGSYMLNTAVFSSILRLNKLRAYTKSYYVASSLPTKACRAVSVSSLSTLKLLLLASYERSILFSLRVLPFLRKDVAMFCNSIFSFKMSSHAYTIRLDCSTNWFYRLP